MLRQVIAKYHECRAAAASGIRATVQGVRRMHYTRYLNKEVRLVSWAGWCAALPSETELPLESREIKELDVDDDYQPQSLLRPRALMFCLLGRRKVASRALKSPAAMKLWPDARIGPHRELEYTRQKFRR